MKIKTISTVWNCCLLLFIVALNTIDLIAQSDTAMNLENTNRKPVTIGAGYLNAGDQYGLTPYPIVDSTIGGFFSVEGNQHVNILKSYELLFSLFKTVEKVSAYHLNSSPD